jgi:O-antigen/teichoic acid export membrane protein
VGNGLFGDKILMLRVLRNNILSNYFGNGWITVMSLIFPPLYIKLLGIEAYGFIGFFTTIQILLSIFDGGISTSLHRQISEITLSNKNINFIRDLLKTTELIYWFIGILIGLSIIFMAPYLSQNWLSSNSISTESISNVLMLSGFIMVAQWPSMIYKQSLMAMKKQVVANVIHSVFISLRGITAIVVLMTISKTIYALFVCFFIAELIHTLVLMRIVWKSIPGSKAKFNKTLLINDLRFSSSLMLISAINLTLSQLDKIILSKYISLEEFGYYTLASFIAFSIYRIFTPIVAGVNPKLIHLVKNNDKPHLILFYHKSCQLISVFLFPLALTIAFFSHEILFVWTQNIEVANNTHLIVTILILSCTFNALGNMPYKLMLAYKWTSLVVYMSIFSALFYMPIFYYFAVPYGMFGVAMAWLSYNCLNQIIGIYFMHKRLIITEKWKWLFYDVSIPLLTSAIVISLGRYLIEYNGNQILLVISVILTYILAFAASILVMPLVKGMIISQFFPQKIKTAS